MPVSKIAFRASRAPAAGEALAVLLSRYGEVPLDEAEANPVRPYVDLGGVKILPREGLHLRLEIEEGSKRVVAIGLDYAGSTLQVQPFAAPRSSGLWHEIRTQIADQIARQGGSTTPREGPFGPELVAEITRAGGEVATDSESEQSGVYLSDDDVDWIETVANEEEPT